MHTVYYICSSKNIRKILNPWSYAINPWLSLLIFSVDRKWTDLQLVSQSSTDETSEKGTRKAIFQAVTVYCKKLVGATWILKRKEYMYRLK